MLDKLGVQMMKNKSHQQKHTVYKHRGILYLPTCDGHTVI